MRARFLNDMLCVAGFHLAFPIDEVEVYLTKEIHIEQATKGRKEIHNGAIRMLPATKTYVQRDMPYVKSVPIEEH